MAKVVTHEMWLERAIGKHGDRYDYSRACYKGAAEKIEIVCRKHGSFMQDPSSHTRGHGCPACKAELIGHVKRGDYSEMIARAAIIHDGKYGYADSQPYKNTDTLIKISCPVHGEFEQTMHGHLAGKGCDHCGGKVKLELDEVIRRFKLAHGETYDYSKVVYDWASRPVEIVCNDHGPFLQIAQDHWAGRGCPRCAGCGPSSEEDDLAEWVASTGVRVERSNRTVIAPREIDIWLPDHNVGIEYHGLYWHTEDRVGNLHAEKCEAAALSGVRLIQVYGDEWAQRKQAVKLVILNAIGKNDQKVMARKCNIVRDVDINKAREFLNTNHVQGWCPGTLRLGLEFNGELVALMVFSKATSGRGRYPNGSFELARYATSISVAGGAGKLLSEFDRIHPLVLVVSYVDHRYFSGNMYPRLGFDMVRTRVDYEYLYRKERRHKSSLQKKNLMAILGDRYDPTLTEREMADMLGAKRILNAGRTTYVRAAQ